VIVKKAVRLLVLIAIVFGTEVQAQDEVVRIRTDLMTVSLSVVDHDGRYVAGLGRKDFKIFENGVEQKVEFCESVDAPFTVLFLFDTSLSMRDYLPAVVNAANVFTSQLRADDSISAASFEDDSKIHILLEPTKRRNFTEFVDVVNSGKEHRYTTTFDGIEKALKLLEKVDGKKAIVFFSDGEQFGRHASAKSNLRDAEEQEAVIYTLQFGEYSTSDPIFSNVIVDPVQLGARRGTRGVSKKDIEKLKTRVSLYMQGLAERTGGRAYKIDRIDDLRETFRSIAQELGTTYRLGYSPTDPPKDGEKRTISVKVDIPSAAVQARKTVVYRTSDRRKRAD